MSHVILLKSRLAYLGGLEKYTLALANAFKDYGCKVTVLTTGPVPTIEGIEVISFSIPRFWSAASIWFFQRATQNWLKKHPSSVVFSLDRSSAMTHYRAGNGCHYSFLVQKNKSKLRKIYSSINPKDRLILQIEKKIFLSSRLKTLFTNSDMVKKELCSLYPIDLGKVEVVHNGVDLSEYALPKKSLKPPFSKPYSLKNPLKLLFVGNDYRRKGLDYLLDALAKIPSLPFQLTIIGKEKKLSFYQKKVHQLGLAQKVSFASNKDPKPYYLTSHCLILPTHYDPFASVTLEALAMGLFVITSPFNGAKEVLKPGCGHVLESLNDPFELTQILDQLIHLKLEVKNKQAIRHSIQHLDRKKQLKKLVETTLKYD